MNLWHKNDDFSVSETEASLVASRRPSRSRTGARPSGSSGNRSSGPSNKEEPTGVNRPGRTFTYINSNCLSIFKLKSSITLQLVRHTQLLTSTDAWKSRGVSKSHVLIQFFFNLFAFKQISHRGVKGLPTPVCFYAQISNKKFQQTKQISDLILKNISYQILKKKHFKKKQKTIQIKYKKKI